MSLRLSFDVRKWRLRLNGDGTRQIDLDLEISSHKSIEVREWASDQRFFLTNPRSKLADQLREKCKIGNVEPSIGDLSCSIRESRDAQFKPDPHDYSDSNMPRRDNWGSATPGDLELRASTGFIDEMLRQDGQGRRIYYIEAIIEGLEAIDWESSVGGIINYLWPKDPNTGAHDRKLDVTYYRMHFEESPSYAPPAEVPPHVISPDILASFSKSLQDLLKHARSLYIFAWLIWLTLVILIVRLWSR